MRPKQHWLVCYHVRTQKRPGGCLIEIRAFNSAFKPSQRIELSQASDVGSIPIARSINHC